MELDEGPPDHDKSTWGWGDRASSIRTCLIQFLDSPRHQIYPQSPETVGQLKADSQVPRSHMYLLAGKDDPVLPKHGSEFVDVERFETVPVTQKQREAGCTCPRDCGILIDKVWVSL